MGNMNSINKKIYETQGRNWEEQADKMSSDRITTKISKCQLKMKSLDT